MLSPKANLAVGLTPSTTLFLNLGRGFHSNDGRGVIQAAHGATVLPRATAAEVGARYVWQGGSVAASAWGLDLERELVCVGDEGTTESSGRTRRIGLDLDVVLSIDNLFNVEWNEAQFATTSRLRGEPAPVTELHFTPGAWRGVQLGAEYRS